MREMEFIMFNGTENNTSGLIFDIGTPTQTIHDIIKGVTFILVTFLIIIGNSACLVIISRISSTEINDVTRYFMMSLSAADLCMGIFMSLPSAIAAALNRWPFGHFACLLNVLLGGMLFYTVFWSLLVVSVERYIAIVKPLHYPSILSPTRGMLIVALIWIASFMYELFVCVSNSFTVYYDYKTDMCWTLSTTGNGFGVIISLVFCMIIPFIVIVLLYTKILQIARRQAAQIAATMVMPRSNPGISSKKDTKAAITFIIITAGFAAGSVPVILIGFYESLAGIRLPDYVQFLAQLLALSNSWWNGVIYSVRTRAFRNTALDIFRKFTTRVQPYI